MTAGVRKRGSGVLPEGNERHLKCRKGHLLSLEKNTRDTRRSKKGFRCPSRGERETPEVPKRASGVTREEHERHQTVEKGVQVSFERGTGDTWSAKKGFGCPSGGERETPGVRKRGSGVLRERNERHLKCRKEHLLSLEKNTRDTRRSKRGSGVLREGNERHLECEKGVQVSFERGTRDT
ncbi:hypothetical protein FZC79_04545 [Rossellomorea vietnamensis]|uniref:Uncharacterized protein n=1 Tax=Rossellomorea vietnamensis TaxID=218284 RepID=A0A5D4KI93_9BACI|nr:hypothetical protein [Rossellomorea vietnamensis]TYR76971.1 hypothetical protein FZC79_04545 [Rossellomorea vietnamensis]